MSSKKYLKIKHNIFISLFFPVERIPRLQGEDRVHRLFDAIMASNMKLEDFDPSEILIEMECVSPKTLRDLVIPQQLSEMEIVEIHNPKVYTTYEEIYGKFTHVSD